MRCFFVSDLHGSIDRYKKLFEKIGKEKPAAVFMGGDLLPSGMLMLTSENEIPGDFIKDIIIKGFKSLKEKLKDKYPRVFIILGNDDGKVDEKAFIEGESKRLWEYVHNKKVKFEDYYVYGYSYIPPTPFLMKDWEKYDVSRYVDPGCVPPEEGFHFEKLRKNQILYSTIKKDIDELIDLYDISKSILLFHTPPYKTNLDRAALDGMTFEYVPLDVHIGSIAVQRFINDNQPLITLHGHVHESARITGSWQDKMGDTFAFSAAHDGKELALVKFDPKSPAEAIRELL